MLLQDLDGADTPYCGFLDYLTPYVTNILQLLRVYQTPTWEIAADCILQRWMERFVVNPGLQGFQQDEGADHLCLWPPDELCGPHEAWRPGMRVHLPWMEDSYTLTGISEQTTVIWIRPDQTHWSWHDILLCSYIFRHLDPRILRH